MATDDAASEIIRPRRRGEPRPAEPEPGFPGSGATGTAAEPEPVPTGVEAQAEAAMEAEQSPAPPEPQRQPQPVQAVAAQPAPAVAEITRSCSFCGARVPLSQLDDLGPLMRRCKDADACAQRAAASGFFPLDERQLEQGLSIWEVQQGALR